MEEKKKAYSIKDILSHDNYIIPIYQRNYAWRKQEIAQLIKDIAEFFDMQNYDAHKAYYLGSLVCFKRDDDKHGTVFELIDGQQRHTTLTLINLVLKYWEDENINIENTVPELNLKFDSRKNMQRFLDALYQDFKNLETSAIDGIGNIKSAIDIIRDELGNKDIDLFARYFYNNVKLFRVEVPHDTDLNHYFEIMNNRGEQLEKHEIVKALLMGKIDGTENQNKFAAIWDACSDMNDYVYTTFNRKDDNKKTYNTLFDENGNIGINEISFDKIEITENNDDEDILLIDILLNPYISNNLPKDEKYTQEKYKSIIDFPNFLLQVLKVKDNEISLDDKKLVEQFQQYLNHPNFPIAFITDLLKYRLMFDKYIIKQDLSDVDENKQNWGIRKPNSTFDGTTKTFEEDNELVKLQVMLYYSDSTNTYNNWLHKILKEQSFFLENQENIANFTSKIFDIAKNRFDKDNLSYPNVSIFNFYFIDFLLWKMYNIERKGQKTFEKPDNAEIIGHLKYKISKNSGLFQNFKFKQISSREHLLSQEHAKRYEIDDSISNGIGNLCLISTSQNSAGNKENPSDKKKMFQGDNISLKRIIMFESFSSEGKWEKEQIEKHKEEINSLITCFQI
jgi:hypothetical protein